MLSLADLTALEIRHSNRAKRLSLRANAKKSVVELIIPPRTLPFAVNRFVAQNRDWIIARQRAFPQKFILTDGANITVMGKERAICIERHDRRATLITMDDNTLTIRTSRDDASANLKRWLVMLARDTITPLALKKAKSIEHPISKIDLRDTSSRWGSCSADKRLMFSWRLIFAPPYVLDYVVGHEVAHLRHMDHGANFWALCYDLSEQPDAARQWLKDNGNTLLSFF